MKITLIILAITLLVLMLVFWKDTQSNPEWFDEEVKKRFPRIFKNRGIK